MSLLLALLGGGCAPLYELLPTPADQQLFTVGVGELSFSPKPKAFEQLRQDFPASAWTPRAEQLQRLAGEKERAVGQASKQRQELARLNQQLERLEQEKNLLQSDLAKLKQLLIDNELRSR